MLFCPEWEAVSTLFRSNHINRYFKKQNYITSVRIYQIMLCQLKYEAANIRKNARSLDIFYKWKK